MWYNGKKKRPGCIRSPGIHLTTFYENGLRLNRVALSKKSDSAEYPSQTAYVLDDIKERSKIVILLISAVHSAVHSNETDIMFGEKHFRVETDFQIVSTDTAHILGDDNTDIIILNQLNHSFPIGSVEVGARVTIVREKLDVAETLFLCAFFENRLLERDLSRVFSPNNHIHPRGNNT